MGIDKGRVLFVRSDVIGVGDEALGVKLFDNFFSAIVEAETLPGKIVFVNTGVKILEVEDAVDALKTVEQKGVEVLFCGTCIDYFELDDSVSVGKVTNGRVIQDLLFTENVITL